jgi:hypothetical protein
MKKGLLITLGIGLIVAVCVVFWAIGLSNSEIRLKNRGNAQQEVCAAFFDKMWKVLQQKAGVTDQYKDGFKEIYTALMEGRYSNDGSGQGQQTFMKWIQESNPQFDASLYKDLMASIEGERNGFFVEQEKLIDIDREHKNMCQTFPNTIVVGKRPEIGYQEDADGNVIRKGIVIIKSLKTDEVYKSGQENDVELFKTKK